MHKTIRCLLYGLAMFTGVAGLFTGGDPLVKYLLEMWHDAQNNDYYDIHYLNEPEIIVLLSLILLVGVRIAMMLDKGIGPASPPNIASSRTKPVAPALANEISAPSAIAETSTQPVETADQKLTRLLKQEKD
jgi:hypothetical protein